MNDVALGGLHHAVVDMLSADIPCGQWGAGFPSFSCCRERLTEAVQGVGRSSFLVHEENAGRVRDEHPTCAGVRMLAAGGKRASSSLATKLIEVHPPAGAIRSTLWERGNQRFENERCTLTTAGMSNYTAGTRTNLLVWSLDFRCGGVNTYVCEGSTSANVHRSSDPSSPHLGTIKPGEIILGDVKQCAADGSVWIQTTWKRPLVDGWVGCLPWISVWGFAMSQESAVVWSARRSNSGNAGDGEPIVAGQRI